MYLFIYSLIGLEVSKYVVEFGIRLQGLKQEI
jgi:hypothetical protein